MVFLQVLYGRHTGAVSGVAWQPSTVTGGGSAPGAVSASNGGGLVATCGLDGRVLLWRVDGASATEVVGSEHELGSEEKGAGNVGASPDEDAWAGPMTRYPPLATIGFSPCGGALVTRDMGRTGAGGGALRLLRLPGAARRGGRVRWMGARVRGQISDF